MNISFTIEEKIGILQAAGYEIKEELRHCYRSIYHNDVEEFDQMMKIVYKDGVEVDGTYKVIRSVSPDYHVKEVFDMYAKNKIFNLLLSNDLKLNHDLINRNF